MFGVLPTLLVLWGTRGGGVCSWETIGKVGRALDFRTGLMMPIRLPRLAEEVGVDVASGNI